MIRHRICVLVVLTLLSACGTRSSESVSPVAGAQSTPVTAGSTKPESIVITTGDITDRPYRSLGDISVTVSKWTIFDADPTPEKVNDALRAKAAELGANAVVLVRYGTVGIGALTWGKLDGSGRAVAFTQ